MSDPIETIAEVIGGVDYDYEQRDQARRIVIAIRTSLPLRRSLWLALTADNPLSRLTKAPSSPVETTAGSEQRPDHTGVIRPADEADECAHTALSLIYRRERDEALALVADLQTGLVSALADVARLTTERNEAREDCGSEKALKVSIKGELMVFIRLRTEALALVAERDATIERMGKVGADAIALLTKERDDARATIDHQCSLSDPECDGTYCAPSTPMCRVHPEHFMPCSRCLGYGCTACDNALQAADDRRSL